MGVILTFVGMDVTTPIDCQVSTVFYIASHLSSNWSQFKLWYLFAAVGTLSRALLSEIRALTSLSSCFLDFFLPVCDLLFAIDSSSHVRLHLQFHKAAILRILVLIDAASIAIWNRNKVVVTLSITVLGISVAFHLQSKSLLPFPQKTWNFIQTWFGNRYRTGE